MAGIHQLWTFDPATGAAEVAAGDDERGAARRPARRGVVRADSGLAVDGERLWLADAETSSLRYVEGGAVHTVVGQGLFDFGFRDGPADQALLQHPLGVTACPTGQRRGLRHLQRGASAATSRRPARSPRWPAGWPSQCGVRRRGRPGGRGVRRTPADPGAARRRGRGTPTASATPPSDRSPRSPAELELVVAFTPPPGQKVDDRFGPPSQLVVEATPPALLREGEGRGTDLTRRSSSTPASARASCTSPPARRPATSRARTPPATSTSRTGASRSASSPAPARCSSCRWAARLPSSDAKRLSATVADSHVGSLDGSPDGQHHRDAEHRQPDQHVEHLPGPRPGEQGASEPGAEPQAEEPQHRRQRGAGREPPAPRLPVGVRDRPTSSTVSR